MLSPEHGQDQDFNFTEESSSLPAEHHEGEEHPTDLPDMQALKKRRDGRHRKVSKQQLKATTETVEQLMAQLQETQKDGQELYSQVTLLRKREEEKAKEIHKWQNASDAFQKECIALKRQLAELTAARTGEVSGPSQAESLIVEQLQMRLADYESLIVQFADEANRTMAEEIESDLDMLQPTDLSKSFEAGDTTENTQHLKSSSDEENKHRLESTMAELERLQAEADKASQRESSLHADLEQNQAALTLAQKQLEEVAMKQKDEATELASLRETAQEELVAAKVEVERLQTAASSDARRNEEQVVAAQAEIDALKQEIERLQLQASESAERHETSLAMQNEFARVKMDLEALQAAASSEEQSDQQKADGELEVVSLKQELERLQSAASENTQLHEASLAAQVELDRVRAEMEELQAAASTSTKERERQKSDAEAEIAALKEEIEKLQAAVSDTTQQHSASSAAVSAAEEEIAKLREALEQQSETVSQAKAAHAEQEQLKIVAQKTVSDLQEEVTRLRVAGEEAQASKLELMNQLQVAHQEGQDLYNQVALLKEKDQDKAVDLQEDHGSTRLQKEFEQLQMRLADYESLVVQFAEEATRTMAEDSGMDLFQPTDLSPRFETRDVLEGGADTSIQSLSRPSEQGVDNENQQRLDSAMAELKRLVAEAQKASARELALQADLEHNQALLASAQKQLTEISVQQKEENLCSISAPSVISAEGFQIVIQQRASLEDRMRGLQDHLVENEDTLDELVDVHEQVLELSDQLKIDNAGLQQQLDTSEQEKAVLKNELKDLVNVAREGADRMRSESALQVQSLERSLDTASNEIQQAHTLLRTELAAKAAREEELQKVRSTAEAAVRQLREEVETSRSAGEQAQAKLEASCAEVNRKSREIVALSEELDKAKRIAHDNSTSLEENLSNLRQTTQEELLDAKAEVERLQVEASSEKQRTEQQLMAAKADVASLKEEIERLQLANSENLQQQQASNSAQEELSRMKADMELLQAARSTSAEENEHLRIATEEVASLKQEIERLQAAASEKSQEQIFAAHEEASRVRAEMEDLRTTFSSNMEQQTLVAQEELNKVKAEMEDLRTNSTLTMEQQKATAENELAALKQTIERLQLVAADSSEQHSASSTAVVAAEEEIQRLRSTLEQQATAISQVQAARSEQEQLKSVAEELAVELQAKLSSVGADVNEKSGQIAALCKDLEESKSAAQTEVARIQALMIEQQAAAQGELSRTQSELERLQMAFSGLEQCEQQRVAAHAEVVSLKQEIDRLHQVAAESAQQQATSATTIDQEVLRLKGALEQERTTMTEMQVSRAEQEQLKNAAEALASKLQEEINSLRVVSEEAQVKLDAATADTARKDEDIIALNAELAEAKKAVNEEVSKVQATMQQQVIEQQQQIQKQANDYMVQVQQSAQTAVSQRDQQILELGQRLTSEETHRKEQVQALEEKLKEASTQACTRDADLQQSREALQSANDRIWSLEKEASVMASNSGNETLLLQQSLQETRVALQTSESQVQALDAALNETKIVASQVGELHAKLSKQQEIAASERAVAMQNIAEWETRLQQEKEISATAARLAAEEQANVISRSTALEERLRHAEQQNAIEVAAKLAAESASTEAAMKIRDLEKTISQQQKEVEASGAAVFASSDARMKKLAELESMVGQQQNVAVAAAEEKARLAQAKAADLEVARAEQERLMNAAEAATVQLREELERVRAAGAETEAKLELTGVDATNKSQEITALSEELEKARGIAQAWMSEQRTTQEALARARLEVEQLQRASQSGGAETEQAEMFRRTAEAEVASLKLEIEQLRSAQPSLAQTTSESVEAEISTLRGALEQQTQATAQAQAEAALLKGDVDRLELTAQESAIIAADMESANIELKAQLEKARSATQSHEDGLNAHRELQQSLDQTSMVLQTSQGQVQALQTALSETTATASDKEAQLQQALMQMQSLVAERDALRNAATALAAPLSAPATEGESSAVAALQAQLTSANRQLTQEGDTRKTLEETFRSRMEDAQRNLSTLTMEREALRRQLAEANAGTTTSATTVLGTAAGTDEDYKKLQLRYNALHEEKEVMLGNLRENIMQLARENYDLKNKATSGQTGNVDLKEEVAPASGGWLSYVIAPFLTDSDMREIHAESYVEEKLGPDFSASN